MSWVNDLASGLGLPVGAATIATAIYGACAAAQRAARPEAIEEIGRFLKDPTWTVSISPSSLISKVFQETFGERHLSAKCCTRSMIATSIFLCAIVIIQYERIGQGPEQSPRSFGWDIVFVGFFADYLALWKTRILLSWQISALFLVPLDLGASLFISSLVFLLSNWVYDFLFYGPQLASWQNGTDNLRIVIKGLLSIFGLWSQPHLFLSYPLPAVMFLSTILTSVWTASILISSTALKAAAPVQQLTAWFLDVEKRPIEAIGIVAGALIMASSALITLLRVLI
jgi:hypothetical protein